MNLNAIRIDTGQPLTEAELDASIAQRTGPQEISAQQADSIIRASWPLTAHRHNGCDYSAHTSECSEPQHEYDFEPSRGDRIARAALCWGVLAGWGIFLAWWLL